MASAYLYILLALVVADTVQTNDEDSMTTLRSCFGMALIGVILLTVVANIGSMLYKIREVVKLQLI